ncbi:Gfo/Idh/MocA family protein [Actinoallomurus iriomotensis]|uniref:Dehydrogenase n=1 Tax=Actinoallomurus iriomotensis TaxID=478107 RepID=A0A9W6R9D9_9ACTN|nr:Gfo/Idh/MocA family oxidoreductase [Actinoallomurus iriomotensis]GLY71749.1 dehydrogenase [Actinoallomurus iriomotensis]
MSVRLALIGLGDIGLGAHLPAVLRSTEAEIVVAADLDARRREQAKELLAGKARVVDDPWPVLAEAGVRGIVLATPPWVTPRLAVRALRADLYVLAEKPLATSSADAAVYRELTGPQRGRLQAGLTYRHDPAIARLREWIVSGVLGEPLMARAHIYDEPLDRADQEHLDRIRATLEHGSPVTHEGSHVFDWLAHLFGGPAEKVEGGWQVRTDPDWPRANLAGARLRYPGGATALVEFGWLVEALPRCEITVLGPRGLATLDGRTFTLELATATERRTVRFPGERMERSFDRQLSRFAALARGETPAAEPSLEDGLSALATSERVAACAEGVAA